jgi:DNA-binding transcriptional MerR regulator/methylmalonyl-CoA mutase cobalamin-binding subunit
VTSPDKPPEPIELSIGTLSSATGVPVDTLRTWERRYGFPVPTTRTEGSHRRYAAETIRQVQLIVRALELGHRPSAVVGRDLAELRSLLGAPPAVAAAPAGATGSDRQVLDRWLELTRTMDGEALVGELHRSLAELGAIPLLERRLGPFLQEMGEAWARGTLRVSMEHFAAERVREFLSSQWRGANEGNRGGRAAVVLATPPEERHSLGLHMAAWVIALAGARVIFLGADTPMEEVAFAVERHAASGVVLSVAAGYGGALEAHLAALGERLPRAVSIAVGGAGRSKSVQNWENLSGFDALFSWALVLER